MPSSLMLKDNGNVVGRNRKHLREFHGDVVVHPEEADEVPEHRATEVPDCQDPEPDPDPQQPAGLRHSSRVKKRPDFYQAGVDNSRV